MFLRIQARPRAIPRAAASLAVVLALGLSLSAPDSTPPASPCDVIYPSDSLVPWIPYRLRAGETLESLFGERWRGVARFNRIDRRHAVAGRRIRRPLDPDRTLDFTPMPRLWVDADTVPRAIVVDLSEQFLGAYDYGRLVLSAPITSGRPGNRTPAGAFRVIAIDRNHRSSDYVIEGTDTPYPMRYGLCFLVTSSEVTYWIHGRDLPGVPISHGCVGLYDEAMQREFYGEPRTPELDDARRLFDWVMQGRADSGAFQRIQGGPLVWITGREPSRVPT